MKLDVSIEADDEVTPWLARIARDIEAGRDVNGINGFMARRLAAVTRDYLRKEALVRHKTADRLKAKPTGHLEKGAENVTARPEADGIVIELPIPGIERAFKDVTIVPTLSKWLTIAATAEAYGRRARSFSDLRVQFFGKDLMGLVKAEQTELKTRKRRGFSVDQVVGEDGKKRGVVYYWLKKSVFQKQDRTLMPSDEDLLQAAEDGAEAFVQALNEGVIA